MTPAMRWTVTITLVVVAVSLASMAVMEAARLHPHVLIGPPPVHTVIDTVPRSPDAG